ncbi:hypothetical protein EMMF5_001632 [Cystobasidiomycetes sp. EMM_F5]
MKGLSVTSKPLASYDKAVTVTRAYVSSIDKCEAAIDKSDSVHLVIQYRSFSGQAMLNADGQIRKWIRRQQRPTANNVCIKVEDKNFVNESKWLVRYVKWCLSEGRHVQQRSILATDSQMPPSPEQISTGFKVYTMTATQMYAQVDQGGRGKPRPYFYLRYAAHHWKPTQGGYALEGTEQNLLYNDLGQTTRGPRIIYQFGETSASAMQIENFREKIRSKMNAAQIIPGTDSRIGLRIPDSVVRDMVTIPRICSNRSGPALNFTITYGFKVIVFDLRHFALA